MNAGNKLKHFSTAVIAAVRLVSLTATIYCIALAPSIAQVIKETTTIEKTTVSNSAPPIGVSETAPVFPATSKQEALNDARKGAGRTDPLAPISGFKRFPSGTEITVAKQSTSSKEQTNQPTQPPVKFADLSKQLVPPPPATAVGGEFPISELPLPPDKPSIVSKLKLTGVIGDRAVFAITDREAIRINKWPAVVMLAPGDRFESIEAVSVGADSAVLEEDGERSTKTLERIR